MPPFPAAILDVPMPTTLADLADLSGTRPHATVLHRSDAATLTLLALPPGATLPHHSAPRNALALGVSGTATVVFTDEIAPVSAGESVALRAGRRHHVDAGPKGAVLLLVVSHCA